MRTFVLAEFQASNSLLRPATDSGNNNTVALLALKINASKRSRKVVQTDKGIYKCYQPQARLDKSATNTSGMPRAEHPSLRKGSIKWMEREMMFCAEAKNIHFCSSYSLTSSFADIFVHLRPAPYSPLLSLCLADFFSFVSATSDSQGARLSDRRSHVSFLHSLTTD